MLKNSNLHWSIIGLVTLGTTLNCLARSTLSVAAPTLKVEFSMDKAPAHWSVDFRQTGKAN